MKESQICKIAMEPLGFLAHQKAKCVSIYMSGWPFIMCKLKSRDLLWHHLDRVRREGCSEIVVDSC